MIKREEIGVIIFTIILSTLIISFDKFKLDISFILPALLISTIIILSSILSKKIIAHYLDVDITFKFIELKRYGLKPHNHLEKASPVGAIIPLFIGLISGGIIKLFLFLQFDSAETIAKVAKKYGTRRFSTLMEWDEALIVFYSSIFLFVLALLSNAIHLSFFNSLANFIMLYCIANSLLIFWSDGTKTFFASRPLYFFLLTLLTITSLIVFFF